jgi:hypothetical protein
MTQEAGVHGEMRRRLERQGIRLLVGEWHDLLLIYTFLDHEVMSSNTSYFHVFPGPK